jgi:transposase InsO family protein
VVQSFHKAAELHGLPASLLTDNGAVFTGSYRHGKVLLEYELERLGVEFKDSRPYHPQTCGKVERLHQTHKRYLAKPPPADTLAELQGRLTRELDPAATTAARTTRDRGVYRGTEPPAP